MPSQNGVISKAYILDNGENPIAIFIIASDKEIFDEKKAEAESIINTIVISK